MSGRAVQPRLVLDGRVGWRIGTLADVDAGDAIQLSSHPVQVRPLADPSGALAGLSSPIWAVAAGPLGLYVLDRDGTHILAYDPCLEAFAPLACLGGRGAARGRLDGASALAIDARGRLLVADTGNRRVQIVDPALGRVVAVAGPVALGADGELREARPQLVLDGDGLPTGAVTWPAGTWEPAALVALPGGGVLVADRANDRIHRLHKLGRLAFFSDGTAPDASTLTAPVALARDHAGRIYVVQAGSAQVRVLAADGSFIEDVDLPDALAGRFDPPAVSIDAGGVVWIADRVGGPSYRMCRNAAGRCLPPVPVRPVPAQCPVLAFDRDGAAILGDTRRPCLSRAPERAFAADGTAVSAPLDSRLPGCVWDRVTLTGSLPMGTRLAVETFTADTPWTQVDVLALPDERWRSADVVAFDPDGTWDAAVLIPGGRYLWLRLTLGGDGGSTPALTRVEAAWPRGASRRYLPAALAPDVASADFLDRFLLVFERTRASYVSRLDALAGLFDALATPADEPGVFGTDFLDWLGSWIGVALERNWPVAARRRLVAESGALFRLRGTPAGLKRQVALYTGTEPRLIEHYTLRRWLALDYARLGADSALWGPEVVRRLQLDAFSQIGQFLLIDTGDPLADPIGAFASQATLIVPAADPTDATLKATIERIVALAAPAHVQVDVVLRGAGFRIGSDAVLGSATQLPYPPGAAQLGTTTLGAPARLAGRPGFQLGPRGGSRLGAETRLTT